MLAVESGWNPVEIPDPSHHRFLKPVFDCEHITTTKSILGREEELFLPTVEIERSPGALDFLQKSEQDLLESSFDLR